MVRAFNEITVSRTLLREQIKDLLDSDIDEDSKEGLHHLLSSILTIAEHGTEAVWLHSVK